MGIVGAAQAALAPDDLEAVHVRKVDAERPLTGPYFWGGAPRVRRQPCERGTAFPGHRGRAQPAQPPQFPYDDPRPHGSSRAVLWILLNAAFVIRFLYARRRALDCEDSFLAGILSWTLSYWVAFTVNTSFDVFLEGPQSGIWFWSVHGDRHGRRRGRARADTLTEAAA